MNNSPFHFNVRRTFQQKMDRAERINRWVATLGWAVLAILVIALCKLVGRWL